MIQKARTAIVTFIILAGLTGCVEAPHVRLDHEPRIRLREAVRNYSSEELQGINYKLLGSIEGISCWRKSYDPPANKEDAADQLRYRSRDLGGNGIA